MGARPCSAASLPRCCTARRCPCSSCGASGHEPAKHLAPQAYHPIEDSRMTALGLVLLLVGATLVVVEAHVPGGVAGVAGGLALVAGGVIAIAGAGGGPGPAVPGGVGGRLARAGGGGL